MKKRKKTAVPHDLQDAPVPPVRDLPKLSQDVLLRPDLTGEHPVNLDDTIIFDGRL